MSNKHVNLIGRQRYWQIFIFSYTHFYVLLVITFQRPPFPLIGSNKFHVMKEMKVIIHNTCLACDTGDEVAVFSQNQFVPKSFAIFENKNSNIFLRVEMNGMSKHNRQWPSQSLRKMVRYSQLATAMDSMVDDDRTLPIDFDQT